MAGDRPIKAVFLGDASSLLRANEQVGESFERTGGKAKQLGKVAGLAFLGIGAAGVGLGAAALKFGGEFDAAYDTIRAGTGATGDALKGLEDDFKAVVSKVPADFGTASTAIADLNTRLGLTGKPLQDIAEQAINLSRITGTDLAGNIADLTRVFGDAGVAQEDQAATLDMLFRATQTSGIGFGDLSGKLVQFGAPLRQMGFSIEESTALLSKWEKEGVNTELVLGSFRIAMGKFAKDGIPMREGLDDTIAKIQELGPSAESVSLAMEVFGARAGPDMAAAILEGRFEIEDYLTAIEGGTDTINGVAGATDDWREKLTVLKNQGLVAMEPVLMATFDGLTRLVDVIAERLVPWVRDELVPAFKEDVLPVLQAFAAFIADPVIPTLKQLGEFVTETVIPAVNKLAEWIRETAIPVMTELAEWVQEKLIATFERLSTRAVEEFQKLTVYWETDLKPALDNIRAFVETVVGAIVGFIRDNWPAIEEIIRPVIEQVELIINTAFEAIKRIIGIALDLIQGDWSGAWENVKGLVTVVLDGIKGTIGNVLELVVGIVREVGDDILGALMWPFEQGAKLIANVMKGIANLVIDGINNFLSRWNNLSISTPSIPLPFGQSIPGFTIGTPDVPLIPRLAAGGIVTRPTLAMIGEAGPEAVVPLGRGGRGGFGNNITINVTAGIGDPVAIGQAVAEALNAAYRANGPILRTGMVA